MEQLGCLSTRHSKKMLANPLTLLVAHRLRDRTSESASPEKWKDEDLGWFPNPKGEYTETTEVINCSKEVNALK